MSHRSLVSKGELAALMAGLVWIATVPSRPGPINCETSGAPAKAYMLPRTPDGQPDLSGYWTNGPHTPLERPKNVTKEFYTAEEIREVAAADRRLPRGRPARTATYTMTTGSSGSTRAKPRSRGACGRRLSWIPQTAGSRHRSRGGEEECGDCRGQDTARR